VVATTQQAVPLELLGRVFQADAAGNDSWGGEYLLLLLLILCFGYCGSIRMIGGLPLLAIHHWILVHQLTVVAISTTSPCKVRAGNKLFGIVKGHSFWDDM
jgi:hypothetical protein